MKRLLAAMFLVSLLSACGSPTSSTSSPNPTTSPSPGPPLGFVCGGVSGGAVSDSPVSAVQISSNAGFDRFVIEFGGGVPDYSVTPQPNATFTRSPKGDQVTLEGTGGVRIVIHSVTNWTSYSGPTSFQPGYPYLRQAVQVENFEGYQQWALGIQGAPCVRVGTLTSPSRLVVDVVGT